MDKIAGRCWGCCQENCAFKQCSCLCHGSDKPVAKEPKHCDDYIHDHKAPMCLRWFLYKNRVPAIDGMLMEQNGVNPKLFADYKGKRVRVTMASRMGDVGITEYLKKTHGYSERVAVEALTNFSDTTGKGKR